MQRPTQLYAALLSETGLSLLFANVVITIVKLLSQLLGIWGMASVWELEGRVLASAIFVVMIDGAGKKQKWWRLVHRDITRKQTALYVLVAILVSAFLLLLLVGDAAHDSYQRSFTDASGHTIPTSALKLIDSHRFGSGSALGIPLMLVHTPLPHPVIALVPLLSSEERLHNPYSLPGPNLLASSMVATWFESTIVQYIIKPSRRTSVLLWEGDSMGYFAVHSATLRFPTVFLCDDSPICPLASAGAALSGSSDMLEVYAQLPDFFEAFYSTQGAMIAGMELQPYAYISSSCWTSLPRWVDSLEGLITLLRSPHADLQHIIWVGTTELPHWSSRADHLQGDNSQVALLELAKNRFAELVHTYGFEIRLLHASSTNLQKPYDASTFSWKVFHGNDLFQLFDDIDRTPVLWLTRW
jgi:hypothetical protein